MGTEDEGAPDAERRSRLEARIGTTLCGRYTLEGLVGVGGMASVYRGRHRNGNKVAVKILHTELSAATDIRARFLREGYVANKVDHRGAVRVLDDDTAEDGSVFLVMELLEGETLEDRIASAGGALPPQLILAYVCELLEALEAAHDKGIVHRDLKPENLFLTSAGLKILDFGIARLVDGTATATRTGRMMGTPAYMAPEQARGETKKVGPHTDLWAAGAIFFRALTGRFVFDAETPELVLAFAATRSPEKIGDVIPGLSPALASFVDRALEASVEARFGSATEMLAAARAVGDTGEPIAVRVPDSRAVALANTPTIEPTEKRAPHEPRIEDLIAEQEATDFVPPNPAVLAGRPTTTGAHVVSSPEWRGAGFSRGRVIAVCAVLIVSGVGIAAMGLSKREATNAPVPSVVEGGTSLDPLPSATSSSVLVMPPVVSVSASTSVPAPPVPVARPTTLVDAATVTPAAPKPIVNCDPPYVTDEKTGRKHYKLECL